MQPAPAAPVAPAAPARGFVESASTQMPRPSSVTDSKERGATKGVPMLIALPDFRSASYLASEASGIASKAGVKLLAQKPGDGGAAILEIHGSPESAATACYFVQLQLWLEATLGR